MLQAIEIKSTTDYRARVVYVFSVDKLATYQLIGTYNINVLPSPYDTY